MRVFGLIAIFAHINAFASTEPSVPVDAGLRIYGSNCAQVSAELTTWEKKHRKESLKSWLDRSGVREPAGKVETHYLVQLAFELEKLPEKIRLQMVAEDARIHALQGTGVTEDPTWPGPIFTPDGRSWANVPGSGGAPYLRTGKNYAPTRIVANRLYEGHGSSNLILHEHGHSLDSLRSFRGFSTSRVWKNLMNRNPDFVEMLEDQCGAYCADQPHEGFAEAVALYYSCSENQKKIVETAPEVAAFLKEII